MKAWSAKFGSAALCLMVIGGCASVAKMEAGEHRIDERLAVKLDGPWNQVNAPGLGVSQVWTMEGLPVDQLLFYTGLNDGAELKVPRSGPGAQKKTFNFRATMQPDEIAALFESVLTADGSSFTLIKLQPASFSGEKGFRFEFSLVRKVDNLRLSGMGEGTVHKGELFAVVYMAPTLVFFGRHAERVERIVRSAVIRD
jgi:hypothetical protein